MTVIENPMLTLVAASCVVCGSTAETVKKDRELLNLVDGAICCSPPAEILCWVCSALTEDPYWSCGKPFCSRARYCHWAE